MTLCSRAISVCGLEKTDRGRGGAVLGRQHGVVTDQTEAPRPGRGQRSRQRPAGTTMED